MKKPKSLPLTDDADYPINLLRQRMIRGTAKRLLDRIVAMLTKLGRRGYVIREQSIEYGVNRFDTDSDSDPDTEV